MDLNAEQSAAVHHLEGPMLVLSGAGSGKTRIVTARIAHLLSVGIPCSEILAVTFTNKAAEEMRERIHKMTHTSILSCTFHSLCARILRESIAYLGYPRDFTIFDEEDSEKLLKECLRALNIKEDKGFLKTIKLEISHAKNQLQEPKDWVEIYQLYQERLKESHALDFDDLLFLTVRLFEQFPDVLQSYQKRWPFILIDEYQDTNHAQYRLIKLLAAKQQNVFAVGDPDQSIYSWRGATIQNILNFEKDFPGARIITMEQNYRSPNNILQAANQLISHNVSRYQKNLWSKLGTVEKIGFYLADNEKMEAHFVIQQLLEHHRKEKIPFDECVIFYRTNFQSRVFEDALLKEKIPYRIVGGISFYQRKEIKDILAFLRLCLKGDWLSFMRTINIPKRGIGETTLAKLQRCAQEHALDILKTCSQILDGKIVLKLSAPQTLALKQYLEIILSLRQRYQAGIPLHELIQETIERTSYLEILKEDPQTTQERRGNLEELISKAFEWEKETQQPSLVSFLEELALKSTLDEVPLQPSLSLMTMHNGKGLEFDLVFLVGMEEDLFPHVNAKDLPESIEEERRLCYVGMTRAKKYLYLTASRERFLWGAARKMHPSRFLSEIPREYFMPFHLASFDEIEIEEDFSPGDAVLHKDFGQGIIRKAYQTSLGLTYDVFFPHAQAERTLVAKYAKLTRT
jgi:DNA helicase II / ATP-dependent DNA helicase PcrA